MCSSDLSETVYTCYVKDNERKLRGIVSLRTLVVSEKEELILNVIREDMIYVNVYDDQEDVSELFKKYGFLAMPVVDKEGRLVGIITIDDILDVIDEEVTEDFERMAGVIDSSDQEYLDISEPGRAVHRVARTEGVAVVLDEPEPVLVTESLDGGEVEGIAQGMRHHDSLGPAGVEGGLKTRDEIGRAHV